MYDCKETTKDEEKRKFHWVQIVTNDYYSFGDEWPEKGISASNDVVWLQVNE